MFRIHTAQCIGCLYLFWYTVYGKKIPVAIVWHQLDVSGGSNFKFTGGGNHSLINHVTKKLGID